MTTAITSKITISELIAFEEHKAEFGKQILEQVEHFIEKSQATVIKVDCRQDTVLANDQIGILKALIKNIEKKRLEHSNVVMNFRDANNT